jgi:hypothetical protein
LNLIPTKGDKMTIKALRREIEELMDRFIDDYTMALGSAEVFGEESRWIQCEIGLLRDVKKQLAALLDKHIKQASLANIRRRTFAMRPSRGIRS